MEDFNKMVQVSEVDSRKFKAEQSIDRALSLEALGAKGLSISINYVMIAASLLQNKPAQPEFFVEQFSRYWSSLKEYLKEQMRNTVDMEIAGEFNQIQLDAFMSADKDAQAIISGGAESFDEIQIHLRAIRQIFINKI